MLAASIDIGGTKTIAAIINDKGKVLSRRQIKTPKSDCDIHFANSIGLINECLKELSLTQNDISGLGISLPGVVDPSSGMLQIAHFTGWKDIDARDYFLKNTTIKKIYVENDVNCCAIGEIFFGSTLGNFFWITISTGINGAIVAEKKLITGENNCAGEIGHIKVEYEKPRKCLCGQVGCLAAHASGSAITRTFRELVQNEPEYNKFLAKYSLDIDAAGCAYLARLNDKRCIEIFDKAASYLGIALSYAANLLNPKEIYIGGGVSLSLDLIYAGIVNQIQKNTLQQCSNVKIKPSALGYEAALLGAAALVFTKGRIGSEVV